MNHKRTILHCDLNNFYASVECLLHPPYKNVPMAVGGDQEARHGVVLAKNMLAKKYGVTTGEPIVKARQKCPNLVVAPPHRDLYEVYSQKAKAIYQRYTDKIESFGIDECWLDVTDCLTLFGDGVAIADRLRKEMREELGLTISVGVSFNKVFAKLGSDLKKPDATSVIPYESFREIVWPLPVSELLYVGKNTAKKLGSRGIFTIGDLAQVSPESLRRLLGKMGDMLYLYANGLDESPVEPGGREVANKSIGNSITTPKDLTNDAEAKQLILEIAEGVAYRMRQQGYRGTVVHIVIKDADFSTITRQGQLENPTNLGAVIGAKAWELFVKHWDWSKSVRMLGVTVSGLQEGEAVEQLSFFDDPRQTEKKEHLEESLDDIKKRFGGGAIRRGIH